MIRLSIVVPVYKVEAYIEKCIQSIINSKLFFECCELVVVDDGSPDKSVDIVKNLCRSSPSVKIHQQKNKGLGAARNAGAKLASGEYIWFVDSDDWLPERAIENVIEQVEKQEVDVVCIDHVMSNGNKSIFQNNANSGKIYSGVDYLSLSCAQSCAPFYIFRREFYNAEKLEFQEGIYHEDTLFTPIALFNAKTVVLLDCVCYVYNLREGSIMTSGNNLKHAQDMLTILKKLEEFRKAQAKTSRENSVFAYYTAVAVGAVFYYWKLLRSSERRMISKGFDLGTALPPILRSGAIKYSMAAFLIYLGRFFIFTPK